MVWSRLTLEVDSRGTNGEGRGEMNLWMRERRRGSPWPQWVMEGSSELVEREQRLELGFSGWIKATVNVVPEIQIPKLYSYP
jgi:hypothetical protein